MQEQNEVGKWVTDGKHTYPYNMYLDELLKNGTLTVCEKPVSVPRPAAAASGALRSPATMTLAERTARAARWGVPLGDIGNMSPQELAAAEAELAVQEGLNSGFVTT